MKKIITLSILMFASFAPLAHAGFYGGRSNIQSTSSIDTGIASSSYKILSSNKIVTFYEYTLDLTWENNASTMCTLITNSRNSKQVLTCNKQNPWETTLPSSSLHTTD